MKPAIQIEGLHKNFGSTIALNGINLTVAKGAIYALVGPNGAGKTTLIKVLMDILCPTAGHARVLGIASGRLTGKELNKVGYVSENQDLPGWMTAGYMLRYLRPFYPTWDYNLEQQLIHMFDIPLDRKLKHLSRGMRMKVAFTGSLAYRPQIIILDEPFSGLDPLVRDELMESLLDRAPETTIFISSHDLAEIESFASHVGYLEHGGLLFSEEMTSLSERFREVTVTLAAEPKTLAHCSPHWLQFEVSGSVVRFVHTAYAGEPTEREISTEFPEARSIIFDPMPLRAIFLAIAKNERQRSHMALKAVTAGMVNA